MLTDGRTDDGRWSDWYTNSPPMSLRLRGAKTKTFSCVFWLNVKCLKLLCGFGIGHRMWNSSGGNRNSSGITVGLVSAVLSAIWWPVSFQTVSRDHVIVFFNRHCSTMNLVKERQGGLVSLGLKRWPFKFIKHFAYTTRVSPSLAGPAGYCPLNFLNLINLKFRVRAPNWCCIL